MSYPSCQSKDLKGLNVKQLQALAKREGVTGYSKLKKDELCREIAKVLRSKGKSAPAQAKTAAKKSSKSSKKRAIVRLDGDILRFSFPDGLYSGGVDAAAGELQRKFRFANLTFKGDLDRVYTYVSRDLEYAVMDANESSRYRWSMQR